MIHGLRKAAPVVLLLLAGLISTVHADDTDAWKFTWSNGFKLEAPDKNFTLKFGGRIQADWIFVDQDEQNEAFYGKIVDGNEFRRARLFFEGTVYRNIEFKAQYDFAGGDADFKDVYIGVLDTPVGNIRVGHFKEPFGLEQLTSSKYITFLERSLPDIFTPERNTGIMLHDHRGDRFTWAVGAFRESDGFGTTENASGGKLNLTARVTGLPWFEEDGEKLFHVGLGVTQKDLGADEFNFAATPEVHLHKNEAGDTIDFVDTGDFAAEDALIYDLELAVVHNRLWAAAEFMQADASSVSFGADDPTLGGGYVQVGYFLTDDHRNFKTSSATFDRLKPAENFGGGGTGAWEIALRYSRLDLSDAVANDPLSGKLEDLGLAVNWYLNPATRLMFNYIHSEPDIEGADAGTSDYYTVRFQVDF